MPAGGKENAGDPPGRPHSTYYLMKLSLSHLVARWCSLLHSPAGFID